jgi:glycosyltransferase involved in cell wall biosynthesis
VRIIHILNHTHLFNGHVNVAIDLASTQARLGHSVAIVSKGGDFDELLAAHQVEHIKIEQTRSPAVLVRAVYQLHRAVKRFQPDIIHAHMMTSAVLTYGVRFFSRFKLVTTVHNEFEKSATLMGLGDRVIAVSRVVGESMEKRGIPAAKIRVILNGTIGTPRLDAKPPVPQVLRRPAVVFVGGLHPRKGVDDLIAAFNIVAARIPQAHLYLVGAGPYEPDYREMAQQTGVGDRIVFCGTQSDPRSHLLGADLFVLPSHAEPGALVLPEAREAGCAIIGTNVGGIPEMLDEGNAGLLIPVRDPALLAKTMIEVLENPTLLADLRKRAATHLEYFTVERVSRDHLAHYNELLTGNPPQLEHDPRAVACP